MTASPLPESLVSRRVAGAVVAALLSAFFVLAVTSVRNKCATSDEPVHVLAGVSYWWSNDYRVDPENGNLPQRWMALPLLASDITLPTLDDRSEWRLAQEFFYEIGNDPDRMLLASRAMIVLLAVALGVLVYGWSARLFGRAGGLISLILYCFSTAILANGRLATSDLTVSLFFLASLACVWHALGRLTPLTVLSSAVVMGLLLVAKMSAILIVPMAVLLVAIRLIRRRPLVVSVTPSQRWEVTGRPGQLGLLGATTLVHAVVVVLVIWGFYGFRYSAVEQDPAGRAHVEDAWTHVLRSPFRLQGAIVFAKDHHLLPEAYLYGQANVLRHSALGHWAYAAGEYSVRGWWWFFPYCFLIKTQLALPAILVLAAAAAVLAWRRRPAGGTANSLAVGHPATSCGQKGRSDVVSESHRKARPAAHCWTSQQWHPSGTFLSGLWGGFYHTAPLWVLLVVYWSAAIASGINIGHRHILPTYPALFILAGGAVRLFASRHVVWRWVVGLLLVAYVAEALWIWPNYLAYFNQLVGGPRNGYRYLVDSSLDWGQDVPGLKRWLDDRGPNGPDAQTPVYFSYFGTGSPTYYGVDVQRLPGFADSDLWKSPPFPIPLTGGYYCVSASILPMLFLGPRGHWTAAWEQAYGQHCDSFVRFMSQPTDVRRDQIRTDGPEINRGIRDFGLLRLGRLMAFLRHREPDNQIGYSILIYHLTDEEVVRAVDPKQPPAELMPDRTELWEQSPTD